MSLSKITMSPFFPLWLIVLLTGIGLALPILQYWLIRRRLGRFKALAVSLLRLGAILFLISFALNPALVSKKEHKVLPSLAILVDTSQSMNLSGPGGKGRRLDEARTLLLEGSRPLLKSLTERFEVRLYALGESLRPIEAGQLGGLKAEGKAGDLSDALKELNGKSSLAVLLSDGNVKWENPNSKDLPLLALPVGDPKEYKDLLIKEIRAPALAFRGRPVSVDVTIKSYGYHGLTAPVVLKDGSKVLAVKNVRINESPGEVIHSFSFTPEDLGQHRLSVSIPPQFGESLTSNNSVNLSLRVVRDKIRILMVSGSPSLNYRFMRMALKNDPSIDLLSFVILRTPSDILNVPVQEQGLIPFPVETLFSKELKNFDLLIFDNFPYRLYISPNHIESVREFVREGGSFALIGGPSFSSAGYGDSPIGEILPVRFTGREDYRRDSPSGVKLSRAGVTHPITQFSGNQGDHRSLWSEMPPLDGVNLVEPKGKGTVLLESADGSQCPILTLGNYGKGRVLVLSTDYSWKWYMGMVAKGKGNGAYLRLIERAVRWLTKDPSLEPIQITPPEKTGTAGQEMELRIKVREDGFSTRLRGTVSLSVFNPDGMKIGSLLKATSEPSEYLGSFPTEKGGAYKVRVDAPTGSTEESIVIHSPLEDLDAAPDHERLKRITASTGGKMMLEKDELLKEIGAYAEKNEGGFVEERRVPLWNTPYALALILTFLMAEWYLRRRWGLI